MWTELPCFQLSRCLFERNLLVLYFFLSFSSMTRTCIWVQRVKNEQMKILIAFYGTLELKGRNKFGGMTHRLRIIHPHMSHLQMYSDIWSTYILRNRYPTLFNHCISGSHCFNSLTYFYLIHHVSVRHLALWGNIFLLFPFHLSQFKKWNSHSSWQSLSNWCSQISYLWPVCEQKQETKKVITRQLLKMNI